MSETVTAGRSVTLSVTASGSDLSYQWAFNGSSIVGATNATLVITNVSGADAGVYTVTVNNAVSSVTSQAANVASVSIEMFPGGSTNWNALANWTQTSAPSEPWTSIASSSDGTYLAAVTFESGIWTSTNAGATWNQQTSVPSFEWYSVASSSDGTKLAVEGYFDGIYTSANAGVNWTKTSVPAGPQSSIASSSDGTKLAAVAYGGGIWTARATILPTMGIFASVVVEGPLGSNYLIQAASNLTGNWATLTNVALPSQPYYIH